MITLDVANTIVQQLGGRKFIAMTGARNFVGRDTGVSFRLPGSGGFTKQGINVVAIELTPADTYTVLFSRLRAGVLKVLAEHHDVYFDSLQEIFTRETGLATHL